MLPTCAIATDCPEWMVDGIVAVTGHSNGEVRLYGLDTSIPTVIPTQKCDDEIDSESNDKSKRSHTNDRTYERFILRQILDTTPHKNSITALRVTGAERQDTLLIGDSNGRISVCKVSSLDHYSSDELIHIVADLARKSLPINMIPTDGMNH